MKNAALRVLPALIAAWLGVLDVAVAQAREGQRATSSSVPRSTSEGRRHYQTAEHLFEEGRFAEAISEYEDGYHLMNTACPYRKAAEASDAPCHADRRTVELLVGAPVAQVSRMVDGSHQCEYVVREIRNAAHEQPTKH